MGVFGGTEQTGTGEHGGGTDSSWPSFKQLQPQQIAVPTGLQGIPSCTWGSMIYGDRQEIVYNNRQTAVVLNDTLNVGQNRDVTIEQANNVVVKNTRTVQVTPLEKLIVLGNREVWVHGQDTEHYLTHRQIDEPVERIEHTTKSIEYGTTTAEAFAVAAETKAVAVSVENIKAELKLFKSTNEAIENKLTPLQNSIKAMSTHIGALKLAAKIKLNALVNWAASSPTS